MQGRLGTEERNNLLYLEEGEKVWKCCMEETLLSQVLKDDLVSQAQKVPVLECHYGHISRPIYTEGLK